MKKGEIQELKNTSKEQLEKSLRELRTKLRDLRTAVAFGKEKNVKSIRAARKKIARMETFLNINK